MTVEAGPATHLARSQTGFGAWTAVLLGLAVVFGLLALAGVL